MIIDAKDSVLGRMATYAAKAALSGEQVTIVNASDAVIIGSKNDIVSRYFQKIHVGSTSKGPFHARTVIGLVKRTIRGMVKRKSIHGMEAMRRIVVYEGVPDDLKDKPKEEVAKVRLDRPVHRIKMGELSNILKTKQI